LKNGKTPCHRGPDASQGFGLCAKANLNQRRGFVSIALF
jgi:hypothetical protein